MTRRHERTALPRTGAGRPLLFAAFLTVVCLGGAVAWSVLAQLESAAMASGFLVVDSYRKTVAHLEGGVVAQILVREHDQVEAGQVLIRLDPTVAQAQLDLNSGNLIASEALVARLAAVRDGADEVIFPPSLRSDGHTSELQSRGG